MTGLPRKSTGERVRLERPQELRLVVLTRDAPEHRYVTNRLCLALPITRIVVDTTRPTPSLRRAFRGGFRRGFARVMLQLFRRVIRDDRARTTALRSVLGAELTDTFSAPDLVTTVSGVNSHEAIQTVASARPDLLLVYGTAIVQNEMLGQAQHKAFNMHTGISPRYRGTDCAFWPVVNREPEWIGATVHECTAAVDAGPIAAAAAVEYRPDDGLHELFARAVECGAGLYVDVVGRYVTGMLGPGEPQTLSEGHEYRGYMRTLGPELRARWALRRGLLRTERERGSRREASR